MSKIMDEKTDLSTILSHVDHTVLDRRATWNDIKNAIDDAIEYGTASVCIPPCYVKAASEYSEGRIPVCTVIGFPNGYSSTEAKVAEARDAVQNGADEIDMVMNTAWLCDMHDDDVLCDIKEVKRAVGGKVLKVIIESCLLTDDEKYRACRIVSASGAEFIKTSTGFSTHGATAADVDLLCKNVTNGVRVKAAGGISSLEDAERYLHIGADRLGTSRIIALVKAMNNKKENAK